MRVNFTGRSVGDAPVMDTIPASAAKPFREICGNGAGGFDDLVGDRFEWGRYCSYEHDGIAGGSAPASPLHRLPFRLHMSHN